MLFDELLAKLRHGDDPYKGFPARRFRPDLQGWNATHAFLTETLVENKPSVVVEVGVWKGASVLTMAAQLKEMKSDLVIIAVDTWLGSSEHWLSNYFEDLICVNGYPSIYYTFLTNVVESGLAPYVLPLPVDSATAYNILKVKGVRPDVVHIDASHDYKSVQADLAMWWELLQPGGTLISDDYGDVWLTVKCAVDDFLRVTPHTDFQASPYKARFSKARQ